MLRLIVFMGLAALPCATAMAGEAPSRLSEAIAAGESQVSLRYRMEHADEDGYAEDALASTLRLRLGYGTGTWGGWSTFGEFDYVSEMFVDDYDSGGGTSPGKTQYPTIADPAGADLNQLFLEYGAGNWRWRAGRQRILLDDERFVGAVGWRQNEQTFDALSVLGTRGNLQLFYGYVANANRIFGDTVDAGDHRMQTHLLNLQVGSPRAMLSPYAYIIDNKDDASASTATFGLRVAGTLLRGRHTVAYAAGYARQSDAFDAPVEFDATLLHAAVRWEFPAGVTAGLGADSLGGDRGRPGAAFRTPLATLHAFQGWADRFLATPDGGIVDVFASAGYRHGPWHLELVYHDFSAESATGDFGREVDIAVGRRLDERHSLLLKAAQFDSAHPGFPDTRKLWVMLTADY